MTKVNRLIEQYERLYGQSINPFNMTIEQLKEFCNTIGSKKKKIILESHFNSYMADKRYVQLMLLEDIIYTILTEIAPKRLRKRKVKKT